MEMTNGPARIISNREIAQGIFCLELATPAVSLIQSGQFVTLRPTSSNSVLPRPFSVYAKIQNGAEKSAIQIIYQVRGKNTAGYAQLKVGDQVNLQGPCGQPFKIPDQTDFTVLVGGGCGVASLMMVAQQAIVRQNRLMVFIGFRNKETVFGVDDFFALGTEPCIATEDGSMGAAGTITDAFRIYFNQFIRGFGRSFKPERLMIFTCGPRLMMKQISTLAENSQVPCYVCWEEIMACGLGSCLGCAIKTKNGTRHVCTDGPTFNAQEVIWP